MILRYLVILTILLGLAGCGPRSVEQEEPVLTSINIIDRNGMSQTVTSRDRLRQYANVDFMNVSPYQKVIRVYSRDQQGDTKSFLTSYHPNGQLKQYLEAVNSRAYGTYQEWYPNGQLKLDAYVIGGGADLDIGVQKDWLFDGVCCAWDEQGHLQAEIPYQKGAMEGIALYYHENGQISQRLPFSKGALNGVAERFTTEGCLQERSEYCLGMLQGPSIRYWPEGAFQAVSAEELFAQGLLKRGIYYSQEGCPMTEIVDGTGQRAIFNDDGSYEWQDYRHGVLEGKVQFFNPRGELTHLINIKDGIKHGEEIFFYAGNPCAEPCLEPLQKCSLSWYEGRVQGIAKSWYDNGQLESQREFSGNSRNGLSTAWYRDGSLMLIEEYDADKLSSGEYLPRGDSCPVTRISNGKGICTLFDGNGHLIKKVSYRDGKPVL
jgi:antitoxin component YwqK of YwqJK toxin-antitoxin module